MLVIYPSVYGQYTEIALRDRTTSYSILFKRHWIDFLIISLLLGVPSAVVDLSRLFLEVDIEQLNPIFSIIVSTLSIYILPYVFIHGQKLESIKVGLKCMIGNLFFNLPLIFMVISIAVLGIYFEYPNENTIRISSMIIYSSFIILNLFIQLLVFVSATLILKEKGLDKN